MLSKYYNDIDTCTALLFHEIISGQKEFRALCYRGKGNNRKGEKAWGKIFDQYVKEFGMPEDYVLYTKKRIHANKLRIRGIKEKPYRLLAEIEDKQAEALVEGESEPIGIIAANVSKQIGFSLNPAKMSVREFYGYVKSLKK